MLKVKIKSTKWSLLAQLVRQKTFFAHVSIGNAQDMY